MDLSKTLLLGFIAGVTIVIGLPIGRLRRPRPNLRLMLNAIAVGVLLFLVWDVLSAAWEPIDAALAGLHDGTGGFGPVVRLRRAVRRRARRRAARAGRLRPLPAAPQAARAAAGGPGAMSMRGAPAGHARRRHLVARPAAGAAHRRRHRPAQLRRGAGDRAVRGQQRDRARDRAGHRVRPAQRHRGLRHRRAARRRRRRRRRRAPSELGLPAARWR